MSDVQSVILLSLESIGYVGSPELATDLDLDSLMMVLLVGELEKRLDRTIPIQNFKEEYFSTLESIINYLELNKVI